MTEKFEFTQSELDETREIMAHLREAIGDTLKSDDEDKIKQHLKKAIYDNQIQRDVFGLNPILRSIISAENSSVDEMVFLRMLGSASYDRGAETQLGGEAVKWLYRASSNVNIIDTDCGARLGLAISVNEYNKNKLVGMNVITQTSTKLVKDANEAGQYLGKRLMVRSPMYCKLSKTDYCKVCVGERLGANPNSGATAVSRLGSVFLALSLKKFHAVGLSLERATLEEIMS
jgi:hypothetical protein